MSETGTRRLVLASTCGVYGDQVTQPINESAAAAPTSPYGTSKLAADNVAMDIAGTGAIGAVSLRAFNIAGAFPGHPDPDETRLIPRMMAVQRGTAPELADLAPLHPMFVEEPVLPEFTHRIGDVVQASPSRTPGGSPRSGGSRRSRRPSTRCWPRTAPSGRWRSPRACRWPS